MTDVDRLERQLDNIIVGGLKLHVNIPKYGREMKRNVAQIAENKVQEYKEKHEREADRLSNSIKFIENKITNAET